MRFPRATSLNGPPRDFRELDLLGQRAIVGRHDVSTGHVDGRVREEFVQSG
jgi:hypothetical protein